MRWSVSFFYLALTITWVKTPARRVYPQRALLVKGRQGVEGNMDIKTHASDKTLNSNSIGKFLRFFIPSMLGLFIFVFPIPYIDGKFVSYADGFTIPIAVLKDIIQGYLHDFWPLLVVICIMTA